MLHQRNSNMSLKSFNVRLALAGDSLRLTGYEHGAVTPFATPSQLPVILSHHIAALHPPMLYLGGGATDVKLSMSMADFITAVRPEQADITSSDGDVD